MPAPASAATARAATPSHSGFATASRSRRLPASSGDGVPTGEFILGYPNHYDVIPPTPVVPASLDPRGLLAAFDNPYHATGGWRDLGRHGSFVVYRKLQQHVAAFLARPARGDRPAPWCRRRPTT